MWIQIGLVGLIAVVFLVRLMAVLRHREPRGVTKPDS